MSNDIHKMNTLHQQQLDLKYKQHQQELQYLQDRHQQQKEATRQKFQTEENKINKAQELAYVNHIQHKEIKNQQIQQENSQYNKDLRALKSEHQKTLQQQNTQYTTEINSNKINYKSEFNETQKKQQHDLDLQQKHYQQKLESIKASHQKALHKQDMNYNQQVNKNMHTYNQSLKHQEQMFKDEIKKLNQKAVHNKKIYDSRDRDPFYIIDFLHAKVQETPLTYTFSTPIPEHEKDNIKITFTENKAIVKGKRTHNNEADVSGRRLTTSNYQSFREEIPLVHPIDPKTALQKYEDGLLIVQVNKDLNLDAQKAERLS